MTVPAIDSDLRQRFAASLFLVKQYVETDFSGALRETVLGVLGEAIQSYSRTGQSEVWEIIEESGQYPAIIGIFAKNNKTHRIGFRFDPDNRPSLFAWSVLDTSSEKPQNHQFVIPLDSNGQIRAGNGEVQYWITANFDFPSLVLLASIGKGDLVMPIPSDISTDLSTIPLDIFSLS